MAKPGQFHAKCNYRVEQNAVVVYFYGYLHEFAS